MNEPLDDLRQLIDTQQRQDHEPGEGCESGDPDWLLLVKWLSRWCFTVVMRSDSSFTSSGVSVRRTLKMRGSSSVGSTIAVTGTRLTGNSNMTIVSVSIIPLRPPVRAGQLRRGLPSRDRRQPADPRRGQPRYC